MDEPEFVEKYADGSYTVAGVVRGKAKTMGKSLRVKGIVRFAELEDFIDEPVKTYSSGMYARLAFALATDVEPEVLLVDEVFGVGDQFFMEKCMGRMRRLMAAGTTSVFVSHDLDFLVGQCDRLVWLDAGRIAMDGPPDRVAAAYRASGGTARPSADV